MSLSLPLMNNLCKRWTLPEHIQKDCDLYFLRSYPDAEFVQLLKLSADGNDLLIPEYGINFTVIFQHGAEKVYTRNGELAKRNEPNNTNYWCSFRSITFNWQGVACTKSYVLVQVDRGSLKEERKITRAGAVGAPREPLQKVTKIELTDGSKGTNFQELLGRECLVTVKKFSTFAERSQLKEIEPDEED